MSFGKLVTLGVIGLLAWQHQEAVKPYLGDLATAVPTVRAFLEMRSYEPALRKQIADESRPPRDLSAWLDERFPPKGGRPASQDLFGNPYRVERDRTLGWVLRSCGPDAVCHTDDDLISALSGAG